MAQHSTKRVYNTASLEQWFGRLGGFWEDRFDAAVLKEGRALYLNGEIREIELTGQDAVIHIREGRQDVYALVEWSNGHPDVRGSSKDKRVSEAIAVAGLYEIEELVADEIDPLPPENRKATKTADASPEAGEDDSSQPDKPAGGGHSPPEPRRPARPLALRLSVTPGSLWLDATWGVPGGSSTGSRQSPPQSAFQVTGQAPSLSDRERETFVRLAGLARKAGFQFNQKCARYQLRDADKVSLFLRKHLEAWERLFPVAFDPSAAGLRRAAIPGVRIEGDARASATGGVTVAWSMKAGAHTLDFAQTRQVARSGPGLALVPGPGLVRVESEQIAALEAWRVFARADGSIQWPKYMTLSLFAERPVTLTLDQTLADWRDALKRAPEPLPDLPRRLRPYQRNGVAWLAHMADLDCHPLLADEMGLGKTLQVLALLACRETNRAGPHLIVCPASVVPVWEQEMARWFPELAPRVLRSVTPFANAEPAEPGRIPVWIASYTQLRRHKARLDGLEFQYAVLDEAQQIKNPDAKSTQACLAIRARHRLALTGTPIENRPRDLWTLFRFLMPGLLGHRRRFDDQRRGEETGDFLDQVRRQVSPFILRRTKAGVVTELPEKVEMDLVCPLTDLQQTEYKRLVEEGRARLGTDIGHALRDQGMSFFTLLTRLRQVCCDPALLPWLGDDPDHSGKLRVLRSRLEEIVDSGRKVVIFSQFVGLLDQTERMLDRHLPQLPRYRLTGKTLDREKPVSGFQEQTGPAVILISLRAGGVGITLHAADYVFLMDPWWNPAVEAQAVDRVHRIGQTRQVFVYRLLTAGTVEDRVQRLKTEKRALFDNLLGRLSDVSVFQHYFRSLDDLIALQDGAETEDAGDDRPPVSRPSRESSGSASPFSPTGSDR
ncbi:MAG: DEAD/DEAH box helicase [Opitutales bacterium]